MQLLSESAHWQTGGHTAFSCEIPLHDLALYCQHHSRVAAVVARPARQENAHLI